MDNGSLSDGHVEILRSPVRDIINRLCLKISWTSSQNKIRSGGKKDKVHLCVCACVYARVRACMKVGTCGQFYSQFFFLF